MDELHHEIVEHHDKVLIVDFGSQVTQLIARRVREAGVYCEIAPLSEGGSGLRRTQTQGGDPLRRPMLRARRRLAARAANDLRCRACRSSASATANR